MNWEKALLVWTGKGPFNGPPQDQFKLWFSTTCCWPPSPVIDCLSSLWISLLLPSTADCKFMPPCTIVLLDKSFCSTFTGCKVMYGDCWESWFVIPGVCIAKKTCVGPPKENFHIFDIILIDLSLARLSINSFWYSFKSIFNPFKITDIIKNRKCNVDLFWGFCGSLESSNDSNEDPFLQKNKSQKWSLFSFPPYWYLCGARYMLKADNTDV